jgi:hypothetical protein
MAAAASMMSDSGAIERIITIRDPRKIFSLLERSEKAVGLEALAMGAMGLRISGAMITFLISRERISIYTCLHPIRHNPGSIFSVKQIAMNRSWVLFELANIHKSIPTGRGRTGFCRVPARPPYADLLSRFRERLSEIEGQPSIHPQLERG